jgi:tetratricopeptide (TPR) repeat protein
VRLALVGYSGTPDVGDILENPFAQASWGEKTATIATILGKYLTLLLYPHPLACDYSYDQLPLVGWDHLPALCWGGVHLVVLLAALLGLRRRRVASFGILFYLVSLSLTTNLVFNVGTPLAERFAYLPSLGICLLLSLPLAGLARIRRFPGPVRRILPLALLILLLAGYGAKTVSRNTAWRDNLTLFSRDVETVPRSAKVHYLYALALLEDYRDRQDVRQLDRAEQQLLDALEIHPVYYWCHYNLGLIDFNRGEADAAIAHLRRTLELQPTHLLSHSLLGLTYGKLKQDYPAAIASLERGIAYGAEDPDTFHTLGVARAMQGDLPAALRAFHDALARDPDHRATHRYLAALYRSLGDETRAREHHERVTRPESNP